MDEWVRRNRMVLFALVAVVVLGGVLLIQRGRRQPAPILLATATAPPSGPQSTATPSPLRVYVSGAVQSPDVYTLPPASIAKDAVLAAGGPAPDADLDRINLATELVDGQQVHVPHLGEEDPPVEWPSAQRSVGIGININTADAATLETLPGIGPALAQRIIDYRETKGPFVRPEDVMDVAGVGPSIFAQIEDLISTE